MNVGAENKIQFSNIGRFALVMVLLTGLLTLGLVLNINTGSVNILVGDIFRMLRDAAFDGILDGTTEGKIIFSI